MDIARPVFRHLGTLGLAVLSAIFIWLLLFDHRERAFDSEIYVKPYEEARYFYFLEDPEPVIAELEESLVLPLGAERIEDYDRYYLADLFGYDIVLRGRYVLAAASGEGGKTRFAMAPSM